MVGGLIIPERLSLCVSLSRSCCVFVWVCVLYICGEMNDECGDVDDYYDYG